MKLILKLLFRQEKKIRKTLQDYQKELLITQNREEFKKLLKLGRIPVALL